MHEPNRATTPLRPQPTTKCQVSQQTEDVQMIAETTAVAAESVDKGYEELVKAHKRKRTTRTTFITFTLVLSFVLLLCDQLFP